LKIQSLYECATDEILFMFDCRVNGLITQVLLWDVIQIFS